MFVSIVHKYTRARKLTPRMLNELMEKIEVYNAEKIDGEWVQRLRIHYNLSLIHIFQKPVQLSGDAG